MILFYYFAFSLINFDDINHKNVIDHVLHLTVPENLTFMSQLFYIHAKTSISSLIDWKSRLPLSKKTTCVEANKYFMIRCYLRLFNIKST